MSCYHPLAGVPTEKIDGVQHYRITSFQNEDVLSGAAVGVIPIPCGKCVGCRLEYSKQWSDRLMLESQYHDQSWFLTLTYDDVHLPDSVLIEKDGVKFWTEPLSKKDITKFLKDLRNAVYPEKIRFFLCGEYGPETMRPHYHAIIFGLNLSFEKNAERDVSGTIHTNDIGQTIFHSDFVEKIWSKGAVELGTVTPQSCSYVARYCMKKLDGLDRDYYLSIGLEPEFLRMSNHPGIAYQAFIEAPERGATGSYRIGTGRGSVLIKDCRYFKKLRKKNMPEIQEAADLMMVQASHQIKKQKSQATDKDYLSLLKIEEKNKEQKTHLLKTRKN